MMMFLGNTLITARDPKEFSDAVNKAVLDMIKQSGGVEWDVQYKPVVSNGFLVYTALITYCKKY